MLTDNRCESMIKEDHVAQLFHSAIIDHQLYHLGLILLRKYPELIRSSEKGKRILYDIDTGHDCSRYHDDLFGLVEHCYDSGLRPDGSDNASNSLKSCLKKKLQSLTYHYAAYAISRVFFNRTQEAFLSYKDLDVYVATGYKNKEYDVCTDEIISIYRRKIIDSIKLKNAIDTAHLECVQALVHDFDDDTMCIVLFS